MNGEKNPAYIHGLTGTATYRSWGAMLTRCANANATSFADYGARGIAVCERWRRFDNFYADMGIRPEGCSLDRIDNNGPYAPRNCRWATREIQNKNSRHNVWVEFDGKRLCLKDWARLTGIKASTLSRRYAAGWPTQRLFSPLCGVGNPNPTKRPGRPAA